MSAPSPSKFDQPYAILGYRVAVIRPTAVHDIDYNMQLLTAPVHRIKTWKEAFDHALNIAADSAHNSTYHIILQSPYYGTPYSRMKEFYSEMKHHCDCGQPIVLSATYHGQQTIVALSVILGDEL